MKTITGALTLLALMAVMPNAIAQHHYVRRMLHPRHSVHVVHHTTRGGHYIGGHGSSHRGGHYVNSRTGNHYRNHK